MECGWNRPMRSIVTWGDTLYTHYRNTIEKAFKTRVVDTYGCSEGMNISAQCGVGSSYHLHTLDVIVEYLDDSGVPVSPRQSGNIIVTRLHPGPMPLIRYKVGDVGIAGDPRMCACGRGYDVMQSIQGRDTDIVITPSGNRLIVHFFTGVLEHFEEIDSFQVIQEELDSIVVRIVPAGEFSIATRRRIVESLKEKGADLNIELELVQDMPLPPSGKRRFIISHLGRPPDSHFPTLET